MNLRRSWWIASTAIFSFLLFGCSAEEAPAPPPPPVVVGVVSATTVPVYSEWVGQTRGSVNTEIRARVQGYLDAVLFQEGMPVTKGQLMYRISPLEYEAYVNRAKGDLAEAEANLARQPTQQRERRRPPLRKHVWISRTALSWLRSPDWPEKRRCRSATWLAAMTTRC